MLRACRSERALRLRKATRPCFVNVRCVWRPILERRRTLHQAGPFEFAQNAAQISRIHAKLLRNLSCEWPPARSQLVKHARLAEGIGGVEQTLLQCANEARVEASKPAKGRGVIAGRKGFP